MPKAKAGEGNQKKAGRPPTGQGETMYIPVKLLPIVEAMKQGNWDEVIKLIKEMR
jgi:hypothetical protein